MDNDPLDEAPARLKEVAQQLNAIHAEIGAKLAGRGGQLVCPVCGASRPLGTAEDVASYGRGGWPQHCGREMRWEEAPRA